MPSPNVFISSTFYDLRYIRENLMFFVRSLGYNPVLSDRGTVFFNPDQSAAEAAVAEVLNCQLFVLVIGGRFGSEMADTSKSITNAEYRRAVDLKIPVFALVEQGTLADYEVWRANPNPTILDGVKFPNADDARVFEFIDEVRNQVVNNALTPFADFADIENYLRIQWASLLRSFLVDSSEDKRVTQALGGLELISQRIEIMSRQILKSVGTPASRLTGDLYAKLLGSPAVEELLEAELSPSPVDILKHADFFECARALGGEWHIVPQRTQETISKSIDGQTVYMSASYAAKVREQYVELRKELLLELDRSSLKLEDLEN